MDVITYLCRDLGYTMAAKRVTGILKPYSNNYISLEKHSISAEHVTEVAKQTIATDTVSWSVHCWSLKINVQGNGHIDVQLQPVSCL